MCAATERHPDAPTPWPQAVQYVVAMRGDRKVYTIRCYSCLTRTEDTNSPAAALAAWNAWMIHIETVCASAPVTK